MAEDAAQGGGTAAAVSVRAATVRGADGAGSDASATRALALRARRESEEDVDGRAARLTRAIARGDRAALGEFYEEWFDRVYATARKMTGRDEAFCLDVVQDVMLRVARSVKGMESESDLARWMARVTRTAAVDLLRREGRRAVRERRAAGHGSGEPCHREPSQLEEIEWVRAQVAGLPETDAALVRARFAGGLTLDAAGALAGVSGGAAHGRLRRVLNRLRRLAGGRSDA